MDSNKIRIIIAGIIIIAAVIQGRINLDLVMGTVLGWLFIPTPDAIKKIGQ